MLAEIAKLRTARAFGLPGDLFAGISATVVADWGSGAQWSRRPTVPGTRPPTGSADREVPTREITDTRAGG